MLGIRISQLDQTHDLFESVLRTCCTERLHREPTTELSRCTQCLQQQLVLFSYSMAQALIC